MSDNVRLWMGAFKSMSVTERGYGIPQIADFLNHLFTDKNLKPRTIAGYRTSVAGVLGSSGQMVSQSLDLNRLIASFHRDRPSANRSIPIGTCLWSYLLSLGLLLSLWQKLISKF